MRTKYTITVIVTRCSSSDKPSTHYPSAALLRQGLYVVQASDRWLCNPVHIVYPSARAKGSWRLRNGEKGRTVRGLCPADAHTLCTPRGPANAVVQGMGGVPDTCGMR